MNCLKLILLVFQGFQYICKDKLCGGVVISALAPIKMKAPISLKVVVFSFAFLSFNIAVGQKKGADLNMDSLFVYMDFNNHGTTAGLWHNHRLLDSTQHKLYKVSDEDIEIFKSLVSSSKNKKLYQMKYSGEICYIVIYAQGIKTKCVATSNDISFRLDDLDRMRYWVTEDETRVKQLNEILKKYWR